MKMFLLKYSSSYNFEEYDIRILLKEDEPYILLINNRYASSCGSALKKLNDVGKIPKKLLKLDIIPIVIIPNDCAFVFFGYKLNKGSFLSLLLDDLELKRGRILIYDYRPELRKFTKLFSSKDTPDAIKLKCILSG